MLKITNLQKTFNPGTVNAKTALNGLDLHIREGDFVTVIGGNGAGKSTMLNCVAGAYQVESGKILIDGTDAAEGADDQLFLLHTQKIPPDCGNSDPRQLHQICDFDLLIFLQTVEDHLFAK